MSENTELKVGKRGEIYTTRELRKKVGFTLGGKALARIEGGRLIVQPKPTALTLLKKPRVEAKPISQEELSRLRRELAEELETK